jgi:phage-related minor tail protein
MKNADMAENRAAEADAKTQALVVEHSQQQRRLEQKIETLKQSLHHLEQMSSQVRSAIRMPATG